MKLKFLTEVRIVSQF